jgi:hypothetical protein
VSDAQVIHGLWERDIDSTVLRCRSKRLKVDASRITNTTVFAEVIHAVRGRVHNQQVVIDLLNALGDLDIPHKFNPDPVRHIVNYA